MTSRIAAAVVARHKAGARIATAVVAGDQTGPGVTSAVAACNQTSAAVDASGWAASSCHTGGDRSSGWSAAVRRAQTGFVRYYAALMILALSGVALYFLISSS